MQWQHLPLTSKEVPAYYDFWDLEKTVLREICISRVLVSQLN